MGKRKSIKYTNDTPEEELPKHLRDRKDVEKRQVYMRNYMRERARKKKQNSNEATQGVTMGKETDKIQEVISQVTDLAKDAAKDDSDPVMKFISKYGKYVPMVVSAVQTFAEALKGVNFQQQGQQQQPQQQVSRIQPPQGWLEASPMTRLNRKYDGVGNITAWYQQGITFENALATGQIEQAVQSHAPVAMEQTVQGTRRATQQRASGEYASMDQLQQIAQNEKWDSKEDDQPMDLSQAKEVPRSDNAPATIDEAIKKEKGSKKKKETVDQQEPQDPESAIDQLDEQTAKAELKEVGAMMVEENKKYLKLVIEYFKTRSLEEFEQDLDNAEGMIKKWLPILKLTMSSHTKHMIKEIPYADLEQMLQENDPKKYKMIKDKKLEGKFSNLWSEIQSQL